MTPKDTAIFPFLLGLILIMALVVFLSLLDYATASTGLPPVSSAIALFSLIVF